MAITLSWNEIRSRAIQFSRDWAEVESERAEAQTFWNEFFDVFGIKRRRLAVFEKKVEKLGNKKGRIDLFWPGQMLAEHKSKGEDLKAAFEQATDYFAGLEERELPRYVVVSDFENIRIVDLEENTDEQFSLKDFPKHIKLFGFIAGYQKKELKAEDPVNIKAANIMAQLHEAIDGVGYTGHQLELFMVRMLFCLFADDSGLFEKGIFREFIEEKTREDGSDLGQQLQLIFQVLNTSHETRQSTLDEDLQRFPYVNGGLFAETLPIVSFNSKMREAVLNTCGFDWSQISPAVFGSMFQSIMDPKQRRNLGAHYTSEKNILKLIQPLFLDSLREEFRVAGKNRAKLEVLQKKLATLKFLDPACGCGNFLVVTYRELRRLELEILKEIYTDKSHSLFGGQALTLLNVDQFFGIELEEFPARIAEVALWLTDHQMNLELGETFGSVPDRLPLKTSAKIINQNALRLDWDEIVSKSELTFILGNPPFLGKKEQDQKQKADMDVIWGTIKGAGVLDYVSAWYKKTADFIEGTEIACAFVSTNSISQGEQVGILWNYLFSKGIKIHFAHRTFKWSNEASGKAAVHCVIIGFGCTDEKEKHIYEYSDINADPLVLIVKNINPYLVEGDDVVVTSRTKPLVDSPAMSYGSMMIDKDRKDDDNFGLLLTREQKEEILTQAPVLQPFIRRLYGGDEFLNNTERYCLWLVGAEPQVWKQSVIVQQRVDGVRRFREGSSRPQTKEAAKKPFLFGEIRQPFTPYLFIPKVSSERRLFIPIGFFEPDVIASGSALIVPNANLYHFGVLSSTMHNAWMRAVAGRMKSDYQYSAGIVYNNFPWPQDVSVEKKKLVEEAAKSVLEVRNEFPNTTLADLYNQNSMPVKLVDAHKALDKAVDACYGSQRFSSEPERLKLLFNLYQTLKTQDSQSLTKKGSRKAAVK